MQLTADHARFPSARRLKRRRLIDPLFDRHHPEGSTVASGSVRVLYRFVDRDLVGGSFQIGVAVGRSRGNAPRRNRIKRVFRDVIRHDQERLERIAQTHGKALTAMVLFQGRDQDDQTIRRDCTAALAKLEDRALRP
jgi:ribonuclease P protein component